MPSTPERFFKTLGNRSFSIYLPGIIRRLQATDVEVLWLIVGAPEG